MQIDCQFDTTNLSRDFKTKSHKSSIQNVSGRFQSSQLKSSNIVDSRETRNCDNKKTFSYEIYKPQTVDKEQEVEIYKFLLIIIP